MGFELPPPAPSAQADWLKYATNLSYYTDFNAFGARRFSGACFCADGQGEGGPLPLAGPRGPALPRPQAQYPAGPAFTYGYSFINWII